MDHSKHRQPNNTQYLNQKWLMLSAIVFVFVSSEFVWRHSFVDTVSSDRLIVCFYFELQKQSATTSFAIKRAQKTRC